MHLAASASRTRGYRVYRRLDELTLSRGDGSYPKIIQRLAKTLLLILNDWGLASLSRQGRRDLLEVLDDRYARRGTLDRQLSDLRMQLPDAGKGMNWILTCISLDDQDPLNIPQVGTAGFEPATP